MDYDLKIVGGTIVDGTGTPGRSGDVGIKDGRLVAVGDASGAATEVVDAGGRVVAPGFVDIHTHYDAQILWDRMLSISPWHGVTTVLMGNCGFGVAPARPEHHELLVRTLENVEGMSAAALQAGMGGWGFETFPQYLDMIDRRGSAINVAALIGHTPVRLYVMGEEATERAAAEDEVAHMRAIVAEALGAGAAGFATSRAPTHVGFGGRPVPSRAADIGEVFALAGALGEAGRGIMQATVGSDLFFAEFEEIAAETGRPITWTALLAGMLGPGSHRSLLERAVQTQDKGLAVYPQVTCRPLMFEFQFSAPFILESLPAFAPAVAAVDRAGKERVYGDPAFRKGLREATSGRGAIGGDLWDRMTIAQCPQEPALDERPLGQVAAERGVHPVDLALDLALASDLGARFRLAVANYDEDEVEELLGHPGTVLGLSDAGAHASQLCDACFSTFLLGHWARDRGAMPLEEAVRMLTSRPAEVMGLQDRGRLAAGLAADVVVLDPDTVAAGPLRRVEDLPAGADRLVADAVGIDTVVVNGVVVRRDGGDVLDADGPLPGRVVRP
ncbi:MAG TPA: amidohydrolase family protein [Acidimicrobiales bacterium]|nr:amidohydrolase family protein [Acidimicrobiales bacterium]